MSAGKSGQENIRHRSLVFISFCNTNGSTLFSSMPTHSLATLLRTPVQLQVNADI